MHDIPATQKEDEEDEEGGASKNPTSPIIPSATVAVSAAIAPPAAIALCEGLCEAGHGRRRRR